MKTFYCPSRMPPARPVDVRALVAQVAPHVRLARLHVVVHLVLTQPLHFGAAASAFIAS